MKKLYDSPELEIVRFNLQDCILTHVSIDENYQTSGDIENPDDEMIEP